MERGAVVVAVAVLIMRQVALPFGLFSPPAAPGAAASRVAVGGGVVVSALTALRGGISSPNTV